MKKFNLSYLIIILIFTNSCKASNYQNFEIIDTTVEVN